MATIDLTTWGISENNSGSLNSSNFNSNYPNISNNTVLELPAGTYDFGAISMNTAKSNITFKGEVDSSGEPTTIIKFHTYTGQQTYLKVRKLNGFIIKDITLNARNVSGQGGAWFRHSNRNGLIKNIRIYDPHGFGLVIGPQTFYPEGDPKNVHDIDIENCIVQGQRYWGPTAKASLIAAGGAHNITFTDCISKAESKYNPGTSGKATLLANDNATNVEYWNCEAIGHENSPSSVTGFWAEGENQSSTELHNVTFTDTKGGAIGTAELPKDPHNTGIKGVLSIKAYNCTIIRGTYINQRPWTAWCRGADSQRKNKLELYSCTFDQNGFGAEANIIPTSGGGIQFGSGAGIIKDCTFLNTVDGDNNPGYNVTWFGTNPCYQTCLENNPNQYSYCYGQCADPSCEYTLENNTFDASLRSHDIGVVNGTIYEKWNTIPNNEDYMEGNGQNWNWIHQTGGGLKSATTTAINTPTSNTTLSVSYDGHATNVSLSSGSSLDLMLYDLESSINGDPNAKITAEISPTLDWIKFTQTDSNSTDNAVNIQINFADWGNGQPFDDMNPWMS